MLQLGARAGPYLILEPLGSGGMGVVYTAIHEQSGQRVALKVLAGSEVSDEARLRFQRESNAARRLRHPNVCEILDVGETAQREQWFAMPVYPGRTLDARMRTEGIAAPRAVRIGEQLARALEYAHDADVVHRDVKPSNLMIDDNDHLTLLDFGLAKMSSDAGLTRTGTAIGTVAYMSPEQATGGTIDPRTDIWAFGVVMYEMLAGEAPFVNDNGPALLFAIVNKPAIPLSERTTGLPQSLTDLVMRCLAKEPALRPPTAGAVRDMLAQVYREMDPATATVTPHTYVSRFSTSERRPLTAMIVQPQGIAARDFADRVAKVVTPYEGTVNVAGDSVHVVFGARTVHEDDALRATRSALALHAAAASLIGVTVRIGVASGIVASDIELLGVAESLAASAEWAETLLDRETDHLLEIRSSAGQLGIGTRLVTGRNLAVSGAVRLEAGFDAQPVQQRTPLVARQEELGVLLAAVDRLEDGRASIIGVCAEAGAGKTRLLDELRFRCGASVRWFEGRAFLYARQIPYFPILDLFNRHWGIRDTDSPDEVRRKLESGIDNFGVAASDIRPVIARLYEVTLEGVEVVDREAFESRLLSVVQRMLRHWATSGPVVVSFQDLHWADRGTVHLLRELAATLDAPVLLLTNFRLGFTPPSEMRVLQLSALTGKQVRELLRVLLGGEADPSLAAYVEERADGTPFFVEELVASLREQGQLVQRNGAWGTAGDPRALSLPTGVRGVLAARIDRLSEHARAALRRAAVIGREVPTEVLSALLDDEMSLHPILEELERADFVQPADRARRTYRFKHALVLDAAYDGLTDSDRTRLHGKVGLSLETTYGLRAAENAEALAWHFTRAQMPERAVDYLTMSGRRAVERYALEEAQRAFEEAYALVGAPQRVLRDSPRLAHLLCEWSVVHYYQGTAGAWVQLLEAHREEVASVADASLHALFRGWLGNAQLFRSGAKKSTEVLEPAYSAAKSLGDSRTQAYVSAWMSYAYLWSGRLAEARPISQSCFDDLTMREQDAYPWFKGGSALTQTMAAQGDFAAARRVADEMLAFGLRRGSTRSAAMGHSGRAFVSMLSLDFEPSLQSAVEAEHVSRADAAFRPQGVIGQCFALSALQRFDALRDPSTRYLDEMVKHDSQFYLTALTGFTASAAVSQGRLNDSIRIQFDVNERLRDAGSLLAQLFSHLFIANSYIVTARRDVDVPLGTLLRNQWFIWNVAVPAQPRAMERLALARECIDAFGAQGLLPFTDYLEARLFARRDRSRARAAIDRARERLVRGGADPNPRSRSRCCQRRSRDAGAGYWSVLG